MTTALKITRLLSGHLRDSQANQGCYPFPDLSIVELRVSMKSLRHLTSPVLCSLAGLLLCGGLGAGVLPAIAQTPLRLNLPRLDAPGNRESGATRSPATCIDPDDNLIALVPESNYGLTHSGYPTFYFYLPPTEAPLVKFIMYDEATNELFHESHFSPQGQSGIVSVTLPNNGLQKPLSVDRSYVWYLTIVCDPNAIDQSGNAVVEATVARVATPDGIEQASPADLPQLYAAAGLWHDALNASASLRHNNNAETWNALLTAVELDTLIPIPMLSAEGMPEAMTLLIAN